MLARQSAPATMEDARVALLGMTRLIADWPAAEAAAVAKKYLADDSPRVRLAGLWALDRPGLKFDDLMVATAQAALADQDERVSTLAAAFLLDRRKGDGLSILLAGARTHLCVPPWVTDIARPSATDEVIVEQGPKYLRAPTTAGDIDHALVLLNDPYNNMRAVAAGILLLSGDRRAPKALAERLAVEQIGFIRNRIIGGLARGRIREGVAPLLANIAAGAGDRKTGSGWAAAEALADIGDPAAVQPLIDLLDQPKTRDLALFALSRSFDGSIDTTSDDRLVPNDKGELVRIALSKLPPFDQIKNAWQEFWKARKDKYQWDPAEHPLRRK
jgi:HEAT repeat protein